MSHAPSPHPEITPLSPSLRRVLVMMTDRHLGNFVVSMPVLEALLSHYRGRAELMVDGRHVALARMLPSVGRIIPHPPLGTKRRGLSDHLVTLKLVARLIGRYDAIIDVGGGRRTAALSLMLLSPRRVGFRSRYGKWYYSRPVRRNGVVHAFDRYSRMLTSIGGAGTRPPLVRLHAPAEAREEAQRVLCEHGLDPAAELLVIHPGAGHTYRQWPVERFAAVAEALVRSRGMAVAVIGGTSERALMQSVVDAMAEPARSRAAAVSVELDVLLALFERAALLVSNESGPTHLAATTRLPIVTLFGPSKESEWRPIREAGTTVLRGDACDPGCGNRECVAGKRCLLNTSVEAVVAASEAALAGETQITSHG